MADAEIVGFAAKQILPELASTTNRVGFKLGHLVPQAILNLQGMHPIGDLLFDCGGVKIGFEIARTHGRQNDRGENISRVLTFY